MKKSSNWLTLLTLGLALSAPLAHAAPASSDEKPFNYGDLSDADELTAEEAAASDGLPGLDDEAREMFTRAKTKAQLEDHAKRRVQIVVHKSMTKRGYQYLEVLVDGTVQYEAPVSTAWERTAKAKTRSYYAFTPVGKFLPDGMQTKRYSKTWQVYLEHVIRFSGGIWIHATTPEHYAELGAPASGGCVRLYPSDAAQVYSIVEKYGLQETAITVLGAYDEEKQVPWKELHRKMPAELIQWRNQNSIM